MKNILNTVIVKASNRYVMVDVSYRKIRKQVKLHINLGCYITLSKAIFRFLPQSYKVRVGIELKLLPK